MRDIDDPRPVSPLYVDNTPAWDAMVRDNKHQIKQAWLALTQIVVGYKEEIGDFDPIELLTHAKHMGVLK